MARLEVNVDVYLQPLRQMAILLELRDERQRQDAWWGGPEHDDLHSVEEWADLIGDRVDEIFAGSRGESYRRALVEIGALSVAALEALDRHARGEATF